MRNPAEEWTMILKVLDAYYERNKTSQVRAYAHQIQQLARFSHLHREEIGGWAGEFTRTLLLIAAKDTAARGKHWDNPEDRWWQGACSLILGDLCETMNAGGEHFNEHLAPGFYEYLKQRLVAAGRKGPRKGAFDRIKAEMEKLIKEHDNLIEQAVKPAAAEVHEYGWSQFRSFIAFNIAGDAIALRKRTLDKIRLELVKMGLISPSEGVKLLAKSGGFIMMP